MGQERRASLAVDWRDMLRWRVLIGTGRKARVGIVARRDVKATSLMIVKYNSMVLCIMYYVIGYTGYRNHQESG